MNNPANTSRANYEICRAISTPQFLVIRDIGPWDQHPTVTNHAEFVIAELIAGGAVPKDRRVLYYGSEGEVGELKHDGCKFTGFAPVNDVHALHVVCPQRVVEMGEQDLAKSVGLIVDQLMGIDEKDRAKQMEAAGLSLQIGSQLESKGCGDPNCKTCASPSLSMSAIAMLGLKMVAIALERRRLAEATCGKAGAQ